MEINLVLLGYYLNYQLILKKKSSTQTISDEKAESVEIEDDDDFSDEDELSLNDEDNHESQHEVNI